MAAGGDDAGPDAAGAAAADVTGGDDGQEEPVRADGAEDSAAQGDGDPVEQDPRAEAADVAGDAGDGSALGAADVDPRDKPEDDGVLVMEDGEDFADAVMGVAWRSRPQPELNAMHALCAAGMAFGSKGAGYHVRMDVDFCRYNLMLTEPTAMLVEAAAFIRANPAAPIDALPIHLKLKGYELPAAGRREMLAWRVFAFVLAQLDQADKDEAAETARQAAETEAAKPRGVLRGRLAMKPIDRNPLSQMGKVMQARKR